MKRIKKFLTGNNISVKILIVASKTVSAEFIRSLRVKRETKKPLDRIKHRC